MVVSGWAAANSAMRLSKAATLARSVRDPALRRELSAVCERLLEEERTLVALTSR